MPAIKRLLTSYLLFLTTLNLSEIEIHKTSIIDLYMLNMSMYLFQVVITIEFFQAMFLLCHLYIYVSQIVIKFNL